MARRDRSVRSRKYTGWTFGEVHRWMSDATEAGDRTLWPRILALYRDDPRLRWMTISHIRFYWTEHSDLVVPLVREALNDPELFDIALDATTSFPELYDDAVACLRRLLRAREHFEFVVSKAATHPPFKDAMVALLMETDFLLCRSAEDVIGALAELFGCMENAGDFGYYARSVQQGILDQVRAELRKRYGIDLDLDLSEAVG
jgi:hypothetical protein